MTPKPEADSPESLQATLTPDSMPTHSVVATAGLDPERDLGDALRVLADGEQGPLVVYCLAMLDGN